MTENNFPNKGHFTLPGEAGYEELTLDLAKEVGCRCYSRQ